MGFCGSDKKYTDAPQWFDPLGPTQSGNNAPTGGPEARARIFDYLQSIYPQTQSKVNMVENATRSAAGAPGFEQAKGLSEATMRGDYLHGSPELNKAMDSTRRRTTAEAADTGANLQDQFTRGGVAWTTANEQAQQANKAAAAARAGETEASTRAGVYQQERGAQNAAPAQYAAATSMPLSYLQTIPGMQMKPIQDTAQIVQGLSNSQGMIATPNSAVVRQPGVMDYGISTMGAMGNW